MSFTLTVPDAVLMEVQGNPDDLIRIVWVKRFHDIRDTRVQWPSWMILHVMYSNIIPNLPKLKYTRQNMDTQNYWHSQL